MATTPTASSVEPEQLDLGGHLPVLDGVRGLAILLVMQFHAYSIFGLAYSLTPEKDLGLFDRSVGRVSGVGWAGVDLFFVLSGFLITGILFDAKSSDGFLRNFYGRRFLRIFPLYYGFLLFLLLVVPHIGELKSQAHATSVQDNQFWYWSYLLNIWTAFSRFNADLPLVHSHFWSLALEEQFYLVWPAFVLAFNRRRLMQVCAALVAGAVVLRIFLVSDAASSWANINAAHVLMPARMDTLAVGAFIALAARGGREELARLARFAPLAGGVALAVLAALFVWRDGLTTLDRPVETAGFSALAVLFASLLVLVVTAPAGSLLNRLFSSRPLGTLGRYAYALYVFHLLVTFELLTRLSSRGLNFKVAGSEVPGRAVFAVIVIGVSLVLAWLSWHLYERQFLKLKRHFPRRSSAGGDEAREPDVAGAADQAPAVT